MIPNYSIGITDYYVDVDVDVDVDVLGDARCFYKFSDLRNKKAFFPLKNYIFFIRNAFTRNSRLETLKIEVEQIL